MHHFILNGSQRYDALKNRTCNFFGPPCYVYSNIVVSLGFDLIGGCTTDTHTHTHTRTHAHTHPSFNGPLSGTTRVSRYQKGKTSLHFTEASDSEWQWHQLGHMQVCTSLQTDYHASTSPLLGQLSLASLRGRLIEYQLRLG